MKPRVCAVSYLNTTPLIWGLVHGPQRGLVDLRFEIPARCAELLRSGEADVGLVPVIELERQPLGIVAPLGILSRGPVRSILMLSKKPLRDVETVAADESSRTSVVLAQILLSERSSARPRMKAAKPNPEEMLGEADACLVIGDPALEFDSSDFDCDVYDLGAEWTAWTGLPMVYAAWCARTGVSVNGVSEALEGSWDFGRERIAEIAHSEGARRGLGATLACEYLTRNIGFELDARAMEGLELFRSLARAKGFV